MNAFAPTDSSKTRACGRLVHASWQDRLKQELPREKIPDYLGQLQVLVAELRRWRDAQRVPAPEDVRPLLTSLLEEHGQLTADYVTDDRYAQVVRVALGLAGDSA